MKNNNTVTTDDKYTFGGWLLIMTLTILILLAFSAISWICVCGVVKALTFCFGLAFSWKFASGIWILLIILFILFGRL